MTEIPAERVAAVRAFNRFYTNVIGLVHGMYLDMPYSLTEARLLFEMTRDDVTAVAGLRRNLDIDAGYLSRVLARFEADGLVTRRRSDADARRQDIELTSAGRAAAAELDTRSARQIGELLSGVDGQRLLAAMREITSLLGRPTPRTVRAPAARARRSRLGSATARRRLRRGVRLEPGLRGLRRQARGRLSGHPA